MQHLSLSCLDQLDQLGLVCRHLSPLRIVRRVLQLEGRDDEGAAVRKVGTLGNLCLVRLTEKGFFHYEGLSLFINLSVILLMPHLTLKNVLNCSLSPGEGIKSTSVRKTRSVIEPCKNRMSTTGITKVLNTDYVPNITFLARFRMCDCG